MSLLINTDFRSLQGLQELTSLDIFFMLAGDLHTRKGKQ